ncbi:hypothetical protein WKW80_09300 [Variovorax humicola]|uniref:Uncharacterized protein n=1 Tax=Variovorax humicola TaxID=1769758 RepID=A0ABU8VWP7_9BURK
MNDVAITTLEGHEVRIDPKTHAGLIGLDIDLSRLCVVDDEVRVYRKSRDELHGLSLEALADLIAAPPASPPVPKAAKKPAQAATPQSLIADAFANFTATMPTRSPSATKGGRPPIYVNGRREYAQAPNTSRATTRVALVDAKRNLVGYATLSTEAYLDLVRNPNTRCDSSTWTLTASDIVLSRSRTSAEPATYDVPALLKMLRRVPDIRVERV